MEAFQRLSTTRGNAGESIGSIPWDKIITYSRWFGLEPDMEQVFLTVIEELDKVYLKKVRDDQKKKDSSRSSKFKGVNKPVRKR